MANAEEGKVQEKVIKLIRVQKDPFEVPLFANHVIISHTPHEFLLHFVYLDTDKMEAVVKSQAAEVEVPVVVSVGLSPDCTKNFLEALQDNFDKFQTKASMIKKISGA